MSSLLKTCDCWQHQRPCVTCSVAVCAQCETEGNLIRVLAARERGRMREKERKERDRRRGKRGVVAMPQWDLLQSHSICLSAERRGRWAMNPPFSCLYSCIPYQTPSFGTEASFMLGQPWSYRLLLEWQTSKKSQGVAIWCPWVTCMEGAHSP